MAAIFYPPTGGGGADPTSNVNITGVWTASDPTVAQGLATKAYVDSHSSSPTNSIQLWSNVTAYTAGQFVYSNNSIWCCRANNTNSSPSLTNNNWRRESDLDSSTFRTTIQTVSANYTWSKGVFGVRAAGLTADITITLSLISSFSDPDTASKIQEFIIIKADNARNIILNTSEPDKFSDGSASKEITGNSVFRFILDYTSSNWRVA